MILGSLFKMPVCPYPPTPNHQFSTGTPKIVDWYLIGFPLQPQGPHVSPKIVGDKRESRLKAENCISSRLHLWHLWHKYLTLTCPVLKKIL